MNKEKDILKEIEKLRDKRLLMPKLYSFEEVRKIIDTLNAEWREKIDEFEYAEYNDIDKRIYLIEKLKGEKRE